jgi:hypothetical protein
LHLVDVGAHGRQVEHIDAERHALKNFLGMHAGRSGENKTR